MPRFSAVQAATKVSASTPSSTACPTRILSPPSPVTRIAGSVPDGRTIDEHRASFKVFNDIGERKTRPRSPPS